jgi:serine/threonine-protein kinase RsbW
VFASYGDGSGQAQESVSRIGGWRYAAFNTPVEVPGVLNALMERMRGARYPLCDCEAVRLAVEEAIHNAIDHGHRGDLRKTVILSHCVAETFVLIQVEDEGSGFRRAPANAGPAGHGLSLMHRYMDSVEYNLAGNCVTLCKHRSVLADG